jgi:hypothetical protein
LTRIRLDDAGENLDQGGLARSVLAEKRVDFTPVALKPHIFERPHAAIALGYRLHAQQGRCPNSHCFLPPSKKMGATGCIISRSARFVMTV